MKTRKLATYGAVALLLMIVHAVAYYGLRLSGDFAYENHFKLLVRRSDLLAEAICFDVILLVIGVSVLVRRHGGAGGSLPRYPQHRRHSK